MSGLGLSSALLSTKNKFFASNSISSNLSINMKRQNDILTGYITDINMINNINLIIKHDKNNEQLVQNISNITNLSKDLLNIINNYIPDRTDIGKIRMYTINSKGDETLIWKVSSIFLKLYDRISLETNEKFLMRNRLEKKYGETIINLPIYSKEYTKLFPRPYKFGNPTYISCNNLEIKIFDCIFSNILVNTRVYLSNNSNNSQFIQEPQIEAIDWWNDQLENIPYGSLIYKFMSILDGYTTEIVFGAYNKVLDNFIPIKSLELKVKNDTGEKDSLTIFSYHCGIDTMTKDINKYFFIYNYHVENSLGINFSGITNMQWVVEFYEPVGNNIELLICNRSWNIFKQEKGQYDLIAY